MTQIQCPNCGSKNVTSALHCLGCGMPFSSLPKTAFVETDQGPAFDGDRYYSRPMPYSYPHASLVPGPDLEKGRKTFNWYLVYVATMDIHALALRAMAVATA